MGRGERLTTPRLRLDVLGAFQAWVDDRALNKLPSARQQEILVYLMLHGRGGPLPRQRVAAALWPDSTDVQALTNLRRELHHLRDAWPRLDELVDAGTRTLAWRPSASLVVDVSAFEAAAEAGLRGDGAALREAARLYRGDLLQDCTSDWIDADRDRLHQRARLVLGRVLEQLEKERAFGEAIEHAHRLLRLDQLDEDAWCALMRCHARRGERAAALHAYQQVTAVLKKELGIQPSAVTRATYREILELDAAAPAPPVFQRSAIYPLVGRQREWQQLRAAWIRASGGEPHLALIRGEAGIGKTRLAEELADWCRLNGVGTVTTRCYTGAGPLAYAPIAHWLRGESLRTAVSGLDTATVRHIARLRPELLSAQPESAPPADSMLETWQRLPFFEALSQAFRAAAPIVLVVDDVQWLDADTIEWLHYFLRSAGAAPCLIVATVRAEEETDNAPLRGLVTQLERDRQIVTITLGPLDPLAAAELARAVAEQPLDEHALTRVFRETEGHPLFIIERGRMSSRQDGEALDPPPQVQAVVAARLALLSADARATAEIAAAVGRDFRFDILADVSDLEEDALVRALDELWRRHVVRVQSDERWDFSHDRIREVAYESIAPARRRLIHRRIAHGMERLFGSALDDVSASIALHLERGGRPAQAVPFLQRAADVAARVWAHEEAIRCLTHGVSLMESLPAGSERDERELALRARLSVVLNSARGYASPEVERNLDRVFALAGGRGELPARWLWVAVTLRFMLGDLQSTLDLAEQALVRSVADPSCACEAHHAMGGALQILGQLEGSRQHFEAALAAYDERRPQRTALGSDLGVFVHGWYSHTLWLLGDEAAAVEHANAGIALARRLNDFYSETLAHAYAALVHQLRRDPPRVLASAERVISLCERYGFGYYGDWAQILAGWAHGQQRPTDGVVAIEAALARLDEGRAQARRSYYLSLLAELYLRNGDRSKAVSIVGDAIALALRRGEGWWLPALYLQQAEIDPSEERRRTIAHALELARSQHSRSIEQWITASLI